jgi:hypothetical protein
VSGNEILFDVPNIKLKTAHHISNNKITQSTNNTYLASALQEQRREIKMADAIAEKVIELVRAGKFNTEEEQMAFFSNLFQSDNEMQNKQYIKQQTEKMVIKPNRRTGRAQSV